jgi:Tol biopolymer transport system component
MALTSGTRFGSYEVTDPIGVGGMGEVYRARDTNLKRDVAIKVLPESFAEDADRLARFQREAEALAALNHPNIAQIYGLERIDGTTALVMELVEGPTLADRIAQGPIPYDEALGIAMQVADALDAAHGQGIVHRDLKPANVKVRSDGTVKVLDFGIATAPEWSVATSGGRSPAFLTPALTQAGILLGTAAYMAPEQARGKPVDERADIWAFGCLLYEMLTGQPAFGGEDVTTTLARVLERETDWNALPRAVPSVVRHTIKVCLQKDVKKRLRHIGDVKLALEGAFEAEPPGTERAKMMPARRRAVPLAAGFVVGSVIVGLAALALRTEPALRPVTRLAAPIERGTNYVPVPSSSRDGRRVGFRAGRLPRLYVRDLDEFDARAIAGTEDGTLWPPCFSPDGTWIAYSTRNASVLEKAPLAGGAALTVVEGPDQIGFCDWTEDGYIYFDVNLFGTGNALMRVPESGGRAETIAAPDATIGESDYLFPRLLPDGARLLFTVVGDGAASLDVAALDLTTREKKIVLQDAGVATYARTGPDDTRAHLLYGRNGALFAAPFDLRTLEAGPASRVLEGIMSLGALTAVSVSDAGTLAYFSGTAGVGTTVQWVDRTGAVEELSEFSYAHDDLVLSPDGRRVAVSINNFETLELDLWIYELDGDGDRPTRLSFGGFNIGPVWTADGQRLIYAHAETRADLDNAELRLVPADNSSPPVGLAHVHGGFVRPSSISFDGTVLIGGQDRGDGDIWRLLLGDLVSSPTNASSATFDYLLETDFRERYATLSPDGRFLAYTSNESGVDEVYVVPYPGPGGKTKVSTNGGTQARWNPNGRELFYVNGTELMAVDIERSPVFRRLSQKVLFESPALANEARYTVAPDGARFLMTAQRAAGVEQGIELRIVQNWFEELKRLAPTE